MRHAECGEYFHADHVDGLPGVLRGRSVGAIETTTLQDPPGQAEFVYRHAAAARVPVIHAVPGERRHLGPLTWEVLWPPAPATPPPPTTPSAPIPPPRTAPAPSAPSDPTTQGSPTDSFPSPFIRGPNDASVTLLVRTAGLTLALLGDLEPPSQQALLAAHPELGSVDILKVAHHGSAHQDPQLMHRLAPRLALISCGAGNPYGHPAPRTIAALRAQGAKVLRTDTDGSIALLGTPERLSTTVRGSQDGGHRVRGRRTSGNHTSGDGADGGGAAAHRAELRRAGACRAGACRAGACRAGARRAGARRAGARRAGARRAGRRGPRGAAGRRAGSGRVGGHRHRAAYGARQALPVGRRASGVGRRR